MMKQKKTWYFQLPVYLLSAILLTFIFRNFLTSYHVLMTTDAAISAANKTAAAVVYETFSNWNDGVLLGIARSPAIQVASVLKATFSPVLWNNLIYGLACLAASLVFLFGFGKKLNPWAALCGALTAFWLGSNLTLLYAGHMLKPFVVLFFVCTVLSAGMVSWRGGLIWGGFCGLMFAQQPDVALFFALFAGAHLIFSLWRREGFALLKWLKVLIPAAVIALLFAAGPLLSGYQFSVKDAAPMQTENPQQKWEYVTQWSWPPEESIAFIAPGYTGWRSGEPAGPYWGRMGRSAGWEQTGQGFMNFKMENTYLGLIPVALALFALFSCRRSKHRAEILFWSGAAAVALLLAFGKFFPLYALFYKLPVVNSIRNPNKFLQVFQVCVAILTAYGFDRVFRPRPEDTDLRPLTSENRRFFWVCIGALGILGIWALSLTLNRAERIAQFAAQGWPNEAARVIVAHQIAALWHASVMALAAAAVFAVFSFRTFGPVLRFRSWIAAGLVLLVAGDAVYLSRHYVQKMPRSYIAANALTDFLEKNLGTQRVALLTQQGVYNIWLTYLLPYNRIPTFNFAQMPRMPQDYQNFLAAGSKNPLGMWRFAAVKYLLGPASFQSQLPAGQLTKVFAYRLEAAPENGLRVIPAPDGEHAVFELSGAVPRYTLLAGAQPETDTQALARLSGGGPLLNGTVTGTVEVVKYRPGRVELKTSADVPAMLRAAERWDADWKAEVDGAPAEVQRVDALCQGVALPAGEHAVTLSYSPSRLFLYMQGTGYIALLAAGIWTLRKKRDTA